MVDDVLLAIGGAEDRYESRMTSAIYAFLHVDQKWIYIGDLPLQFAYLDTLLLREGALLIADGCNRHVWKVTVNGKQCCILKLY